MLVHDAKGRSVAAAADALWYPLWDAGLVLGHAVRTPKEALALAGSETDALTALLDARCVAGDADLVARVIGDARSLARRRRSALVRALRDAAVVRHQTPGPVAEMLEPNLKDGAGGLRDLQSLAWVGWGVAEVGGTEALVGAGCLQPADVGVLAGARSALLDARVALHLVTGTSGDVLLLQEQDAVARALDVPSADDLVRTLASHGRAVTWLADDVWRRVDAATRGPSGRLGRRDSPVAPGIVVRDGAVTLVAETAVDAATVLRAAAVAVARDAPIERASLELMRELTDVVWDDEARGSFIAVLRGGRRAVPVLEALDQVGVMAKLLPEWDHVRARPQRNAYHRFTVDRHLVEAVAECVEILDGEGFDAEVAARVRPELLLLGALLHDLAKGMPGDHSEVGAEVARAVVARMGLDRHGTEVVAWLVRQHLLLADTATRRDLGDERTIVRFGQEVGDTERLDLLYVLTIGDSRGTGPAAWSSAKAALVRQLFVETDTLLERGVVSGRVATAREEALGRNESLLEGGILAVSWREDDDGLLECTVVAPDRTGLLATVAGVLALHGFDIRAASAYGADSGMALEVFRGVDAFGRLDAEGRAAVERDVRAALSGELALRARLEDRIKRYPQAHAARAEGVRVAFDLDASTAATVVEVHAPDEVALLARVAAVFTDLELDVTAALVSTLGARVVDVFYVRDAQGAKITDPVTLEHLRATLEERLHADTLLT